MKKTIYNPTSLLLYLRSCYGLTQQQLVWRCRLSCNDVCQFELRHSLTVGKLKALADFFHVSVDDLYHDRFASLPGLLRPTAHGQGGRLRECIRRQQRCEEIGDAGERWVYELEKARLKGTPTRGWALAPSRRAFPRSPQKSICAVWRSWKASQQKNLFTVIRKGSHSIKSKATPPATKLALSSLTMARPSLSITPGRTPRTKKSCWSWKDASSPCPWPSPGRRQAGS